MVKVALYGSSLVLATIRARLERCTSLQPLTIDPAQPGAFEALSAFQPDVLVLDLGSGEDDPVRAFWKARPEVSLIGVDLDGDRMLVLSGQPARRLTAEDLVEALTMRAKAATA